MPHCILEYSSNIIENPDPKDLLLKINQSIAETSGIKIENIKSRLLKRGDFVVSDGSNNQAYVHLEIGILDGRDDDFKQSLGEALHQLLLKEFSETAEQKPCSISVEIREIEKSSYKKHTTC